MTDDRTAEEAAAEALDHKHPALPEQYNESFARGQTELPHDPALEPGPNFARGVAEEPGPHSEELGRFSRGEEDLPESDPEKHVERRFSEGQERSPTSD
jgi:hypothetical protein